MSNVFFEYEMGETLRDVVTGFQGVVMARAQFSTGCIHYGIQPVEVGTNGKLPDWEWLDSSRMEKVGNKTVGFKRAKEGASGGPAQNPPTMN